MSGHGHKKGIDFDLGVFDKIYDWYGKLVDKDFADTLKIGDIVRLMLIFKERKFGSEEIVEERWSKFYVEITQIDKYSDSQKPRKFHGQILDTYLIYPWDLEFVGLDLTFRKENILEIPSWKKRF